MKSLAQTLATLTALVPLALAVPAVTPVPLTPPSAAGTCTYWPGWIRTPDADTTGSLMFEVASADDGAVTGLPLQPFSLTWAGSPRPLLGADLRASTSFAKAYYRCNKGQAVVGTSNPFENITVSKESRNAFAQIDGPAESGYALEVYAHEVDGVRQDGVFLGAQNQTTWGFYYHEASCAADGTLTRDFYEVKLQGLPEDPDFPPTAGYPVQFEGFIQVKIW